MEKYIKIEAVFDSEGVESIKYTSEGFTQFEIIGMLTFYRDQTEVDFMRITKTVKAD